MNRNKVLERVNWPVFDNIGMAVKLERIAFRSYRKNTLEGYLASLLIFQQIVEGLLKLLIRTSEFIVECSIHPAKIDFRKHDEQMFGQLLKELGTSIKFKERQRLIQKCKDLNEIRIAGVHQINDHKNIAEIKKTTKRVKKLYLEIFDLFDKGHDYYLERLGKIRQDAR